MQVSSSWVYKIPKKVNISCVQFQHNNFTLFYKKKWCKNVWGRRHIKVFIKISRINWNFYHSWDGWMWDHRQKIKIWSETLWKLNDELRHWKSFRVNFWSHWPRNYFDTKACNFLLKLFLTKILLLNNFPVQSIFFVE